jgi:hypothetical protein
MLRKSNEFMLAALKLAVFQHAAQRKLSVGDNTYMHRLLTNMNVGISQVVLCVCLS